MELIDKLTELLPTAKRQTLKRLVEAGRVTVDSRRATRLKQPIEADSVVKIQPARPKANPAEAMKPPFPIVYEDTDLIVIDKPPGLLTSTTPNEPRPTALAILRNYCAAVDPRVRVQAIHRLDRDASGLLVFAKSTIALASLKTQFAAHTAQRIYAAVVSPTPKKPTQRIESRLRERPDGSVYSARSGQLAVTEYVIVDSKPKRALLRVILHTGRKHQIRVHLAENLTPIIGDPIYDRPDPAGLLLAAIELHFDHPRTGERKKFHLDLPPRLSNAMRDAER